MRAYVHTGRLRPMARARARHRPVPLPHYSITDSLTDAVDELLAARRVFKTHRCALEFESRSCVGHMA
jgi:hypothetical protein